MKIYLYEYFGEYVNKNMDFIILVVVVDVVVVVDAVVVVWVVAVVVVTVDVDTVVVDALTDVNQSVSRTANIKPPVSIPNRKP